MSLNLFLNRFVPICIVDGLAFSTIGSAVPGGEEILRIIPQTDAMVVQARVAASDIEQVKVGQKARVNFSGLNQQTTPVVTGKVIFVSADRAEDPRTGASFYRVNVAIDARSFRRETGLAITSGMPADAFITTSSRSMLAESGGYRGRDATRRRMQATRLTHLSSYGTNT